MYESIEIEVSQLSDESKDFITQNTSQQKAVLLLYRLHNQGIIDNFWGIAALTEQRLLCTGLMISVYKLNPGTIFDHDEEDYKDARVRRRIDNIQYYEIQQMHVKRNKVCIGLGYRSEIRIPFGISEHAEKFLRTVPNPKSWTQPIMRNYNPAKGFNHE